jgi:hypothetical protein
MKTAKEKAEELVEKIYLIEDARGLCILDKYTAKQCALIAVDEMYLKYI